MEFYDIYTADGQLTGRAARKGTPCTGGDYYLGVHVYLYDSNGRFLLQKRASDKAFLPGGWEVHMGHVMAGETALQAARRETAEELGVCLPSERFIPVARFVWNELHHLVDIFFAKADLDAAQLHLQTRELTEAKWISKAEMVDFIQRMTYRPAEYRMIVRQHIEHAIFTAC